jgi:hypothetical protein
MSNEGHISGIIIEESHPPDGNATIHRWNDAALARIPETDDKFPGLVRSMFAAPRADVRFTSFRRSRAIAVALHGDRITDSLHEWLPKFEAVLRDLYWIHAILYINGGWMGRFQIDYNLDHNAQIARRDAKAAGLHPPLPASFCFTVNTLPEGRLDRTVLTEVHKLPTHPPI